MNLDGRVNLFHWLIALAAWAIGLYALRRRSGRR
jgi:hypothetical protein